MKLFNTNDTVKRVISGVEFEVARSNNHNYKNKLKQLIKPVKRDWDLGKLPSEQEDLITAQAMAGTILVGWDGWLVNNHQFKYSSQECEKLLIEDDVLRNKISGIALDYENFLAEDEVETVKK